MRLREIKRGQCLEGLYMGKDSNYNYKAKENEWVNGLCGRKRR